MHELTSCPPNFKIDRIPPKHAFYLHFSQPVKIGTDLLKIPSHVTCTAKLKNTGLERSESFAKDLEWFKEQGYAIPEPSTPIVNYAKYLKELSEKDPQAFICHFYNIYFAHSAGQSSKLITRNFLPATHVLLFGIHVFQIKQSQFKPFPTHLYFLLFQAVEKILNGKGLEFYKWDGDLSQLLQNVREKLNKVAERREEPLLERNREIFKYSGDILRLILS
ncbi:hypothetical protein UlMin_044025 [Ulmus minor]